MICSCCNNQYDDNFLSCPFCGTASAVTNTSNTTPCPKCGSPVMPGQPMCQQCGLIDPVRTNSGASAAVTMPNVGDPAPNEQPRSVRIESDNPYGQNNPYQQQNPYGQSSPYQQNTPYQQNAYGQNPYQNPYQQNPYGQNTYNQNSYGQSTMPPYMQNPYQPYGNPADPMYQQEVKKVKNQATLAMVFAILIPLVAYIFAALASSRAKKIGYTGSSTLITVAVVVAIINHVLGFLMQMSQYT